MSTTSKPVADEQVRLDMYRMMQEARLFEKRAQDLFLEGLIKGTSHLALGQEAVAAGFAAALRPEDLVYCTYRGHVHTLLRGAPMGALMAELMGRANGICGGKGGSMHLTDVSHGAMGSYAIVGAHMPIAAGAAWAAQERGTGQVVVCFFGDGTTNIGAFHEALNLAVVWQLPVVYVCENNLYMEYTPIGAVTAVANPAADRASAYGLEPIVVDGNDVDEVFETATRLVDRAREGGGPALVEAKTYRHGGHSRADPAKYRPDDEVKAWLARDPIPTYRDRLLASGVDADDDRPCRTRGARAGRPRDRGGEGRARTPNPRRSGPSCGPTGGPRGGADVPGGGQPGDRAGDGARPERVLHRGGRRGGRRGVQDDRGAVRTVRPQARPGHADLGAGDHRRDHGRGHERAPPGGRADVQRLLRGLLGPDREPDREDPLHDERPGGAAARDPHRERRRRALRRAALAERRGVGDGDPGAEGGRAFEPRGHDRAVRGGRARPRPRHRRRAEGALRDQGRGPRRRGRRPARFGQGAPAGIRRDDRGARRDGAEIVGGRGGARGRRHRRRGHRRALARPARRDHDLGVGRQDRTVRHRRGEPAVVRLGRRGRLDRRRGSLLRSRRPDRADHDARTSRCPPPTRSRTSRSPRRRRSPSA